MTAHRWLTKRHSSLLSRACSTEGSCGSPSSRDRRRQHLLGRARRRGAAPRRIVRRLDRRRAHPRLLRASHSVFTSRAADKVSSRPPPSQSPPQRCTAPARSRREDARSAQLCLVRPSNRRVASHLRTSHLPPHCHCRGRADATPGPAHLTRAPPPRHGPTKARREEVQAAIESLPASSWALKRSLTRPSLAAPVTAVAGDGITGFALSSIFLPALPVCRPSRAGGKRLAEPSATSWRAHAPPKGRTGPWLRRRLRRERRR